MGLAIPNLDDKTFEELVKEARALIPRYAPEWTDHNVHDPGITFIELFAWLAEMQIYQLDRVTDASYLKFLRLLGFKPTPPQSSRVDVVVGEIKKEKFLEKGTWFITCVGTERIVFETGKDFTLVPLLLKSIITSSAGKRTENIHANRKDDIYFNPFDNAVAGDAALELGFDNELPGKEIQLLFDLFEGDLPPMTESENIIPSVALAWEYLTDKGWIPLAITQDSTFDLTRSGRIIFVWPSETKKEADCYWIRCRLVEGSYEIPPLINTILLNSVSAVQVESVREDLPGTGFPGQTLKLQKSFFIPGSLKIGLENDSNKWEEVMDFDSSGPDDRHYTFDPSSVTITFGNGLNGKIPLKDETINAFYRITLGEKGNVPSGLLFTFNNSEGLSGTNPGPATGGKSAETLDAAKARARKDLQTTYRAVTASDYEELAIKTPGLRVKRAKAIPGYHPEYPCIEMPGTVTVVVVPAARQEARCPVPGKGFLLTVAAYLENRRLITTALYVIGPEYVVVSVTCKVRPKTKSDGRKVEELVRERLKKFLDPLSGGPDGDGWPFGRPVYPSEIYQLLDKTDGVDFATSVALTAEGYKPEKGIIKIPKNALTTSGELQVSII